jgi:hypothetical protein
MKEKHCSSRKVRRNPAFFFQLCVPLLVRYHQRNIPLTAAEKIRQFQERLKENHFAKKMREVRDKGKNQEALGCGTCSA